MEDLPNEYDVIVVGTGMTGSIVAAALSRIGKSVLHLDENDYYGEEWASFNLDTIDSLLNPHPIEIVETIDPTKLLEPFETFIPTAKGSRITNLKNFWSCKEKNESRQLVEDGTNPSEEETNKEQNDESWSQEKIRKEYRKFNIDLSPRMLYSRGPLVELLISSNISRYAEFKSVSRVLTWRNSRLEVVPCSRADVFATRHVSVVQKRMLVKILTLFSEYPACQEEFQGFVNKTFIEYLKHKKLDDQLIHYIVYAIAMGGDSTPCLEGVASCKRFLLSLGRYGNTPFICPLYGSGELPQCFCRLCAVFGGVYHLKRQVDGLVLNNEKKIVAIISGGQRLKAEQIVLTSNVCPPELLEPYEGPLIHRGVYITDRSLVESDTEAVTLLQFPPQRPNEGPVTVMEMGGSCHVCPSGLFVVHMTAEGRSEEEPLHHVQDALFRTQTAVENEDSSKPVLLWSMTWCMAPGSSTLKAGAPSNLKITSGPDAGVDFDVPVSQAKEIFKELYPDEEFLPRAPDPDEIVLEDPELLKEENTEKTMSYEENQADNDLSKNVIQSKDYREEKREETSTADITNEITEKINQAVSLDN